MKKASKDRKPLACLQTDRDITYKITRFPEIIRTSIHETMRDVAVYEFYSAGMYIARR